MNARVQRLLSAFRDILTSADLAAKGGVGSPEQPILEVAELIEMFEGMNGVPCPRSLQPGLVLPHPVSVRWQFNQDVSGEVNIRNVFSTMHRTLDPSLQTVVVNGHLLGNMRIADEVVVKAGPLHTLFEVEGGRIAEK